MIDPQDRADIQRMIEKTVRRILDSEHEVRTRVVALDKAPTAKGLDGTIITVPDATAAKSIAVAIGDQWYEINIDGILT